MEGRSGSLFDNSEYTVNEQYVYDFISA